jgi:hypothetical protein
VRIGLQGRGPGTAYPVIIELEAVDIWDVEDNPISRVIGLRSGNVSPDTVDLFIRPLGSRSIGISKPRKKDKIRMRESTFGRALMTSACEESYSRCFMNVGIRMDPYH